MTLKESLMNIKDFRIDRCKKHSLCDILMIVLICYLTGCKDIDDLFFEYEKSRGFTVPFSLVDKIIENVKTVATRRF